MIVTLLASGAVVVAAAVALAHYGDAIGERTGLGGVSVGSVLLGGATSLPELTTDISAVRLGAIDLAAGDLFGSTLANMLLLALVDLMPPRQQVLRKATLDHSLLAALAILLNALAAIFILSPLRISFGRVGPEPLVLIACYVLGIRAVHRQATRAPAADPAAAPPPPSRGPSLAVSVVGFALAALAILLAAPYFAQGAKDFAEATGLGLSFVGTLLVGFATSLPELVSSIAAIRMGSYDLAVGNLLGSCAFNMIIFAALDVATPTPIFGTLSPVHATTALFGVVLLSLALAAIVFRAERRFALIEPDSFLMVVAYALAMVVVYRQGRTG